jgi:Uma2 family endonuclease
MIAQPIEVENKIGMTPRRFTVDEYLRLAELGFFAESDRKDFYSEQHPGPDAVYLLIEVADTSLAYDRKTKGEIHAKAGISDYWLVNLPERQIEVHREPRSTGYRTTTRYMPGDTLSPLAFPEIILGVDEILGVTS